MSPHWLGYPQAVLAVWGPLAAVGLWRAALPLLGGLPPALRFRLATAAALTPALAFFVPYLPDSPLRDALPWRAPLAWGISTPVDGVGIAHLGMEMLTLLVLASLAVSFVLGAVSALRLQRRIGRMRPRRLGDVWVVDVDGFVACTVGVLRPRVVVAAGVERSPGGAAIVAHEREHARSRHPMWIFLSACVLRGFWWIPGRRALLSELELCAELAADRGARERVGVRALARALRDHLPRPDGGRRPLAQPVGFVDPHVQIVERAIALAAPRVTIPAAASLGVHLTATAVVLLLVVLL